jgi:hypothetical protein
MTKPKLKVWEQHGYHHTSETILNILRQQTQNTRSDLYFRVLASYFLAQMASSMRTYVSTKDRGNIPVNAYVCALMESGAGKGHSMNIMEDQIVNQFKTIFTTQTFPSMAKDSIDAEAANKSVVNNTSFDEEVKKLQREFDGYGAMPYSFSEGTGPAYKQIRTKAQIASIGSLNYICDEIGSNLLNAAEIFTVCLETYDVGKVKDKITKSSSDNIRHEPRTDPVPSNMLVFGTPAKVFNGAKEEVEFMSLQETGYARRFLYGFGNKGTDVLYTADELYDLLSSNTTSSDMTKLSNLFALLADEVNANRVITVERTQGIELLQYKLDCEANAELLPEHDHIRKAEMQHRYFKSLKLAGAYAFVDQTPNITSSQLYAAIRVVEDSALAFNQILTRPKPYERLARYIATVGEEITHADLVEELPFYRGSNTAKNEMLQLASAWGYKHNIIIKRYFSESIEFMKGESLAETNLDSIMLSYSNHEAYNYRNETTSFKNLTKLTQAQGLHWVNHHLIGGDDRAEPKGHRVGASVKAGFNMIVIDCDGEIALDTAKLLLQDFTALYYTTKRHTEEKNRFRIILPMKYQLNLDEKDFKEFMLNIYSWLPFRSDDSTNQRCKKWLCNKGQSFYTDGELLDPLPFIPKTTKNEERKKGMSNLSSLDNTERWFAQKIQEKGNRNNHLLKYAFMLKDSGMTYEDVETALITFNAKLPDPLNNGELGATILKTIASKYI